MAVFSFNKSYALKIFAFITAVLVIVAAGVSALSGGQRKIISYATADEIGRYSTEANSIEARADFFSLFNIEIESESEFSDTVIIPSEFSETYLRYNKLQKEIGLDLSPFKGEKVSRLTYKIKSKELFATLLIYKNHVIGAHISTGVYGEGYESLLSKQYGKTG